MEMSYRLKSELERKIQEWMNENCEEDDWPTESVIGEKTVKLMTDNAFNILLAIAEAIEYGKREDLL